LRIKAGQIIPLNGYLIAITILFGIINLYHYRATFATILAGVHIYSIGTN